MESIAGKSTILRAFRHLALVGMVAAGLSGCAHDATDDYAAYLDANEAELPFSQTGYEAQYHIAPQVRNHTYSFSSAMAGAANVWNVQFGTVLADTLESDNYRAAFTTLSETRETTPSEGLLFKYERANYRFINNRAEITLHIIVDKDGQRILDKKYSRNGITQTGKMFWGGVFTMNNAIQQSTKSALDQILTASLVDFQVAMKKPIEAPQTALAASASAGAATTLSDAASDQKQVSEARAGRKQDAAADAKAVAESLAALKILHDQGVLSDEEYMQKQRAIINEHTRRLEASLRGDETNVSVATVDAYERSQPRSLRVAILPFASAPAWFSSAEIELSEFSQDFVKDQRNLELAYSYYSSKLESNAIDDPASYWSGGYGVQEPIESRVYAVGNQLDVDIALMFYHKRRTADAYANELYEADVYVFDLRRKRLYRNSGDETHIQEATRQAFRELIREK
jgi:hypothetical protein